MIFPRLAPSLPHHLSARHLCLPWGLAFQDGTDFASQDNKVWEHCPRRTLKNCYQRCFYYQACSRWPRASTDAFCSVKCHCSNPGDCQCSPQTASVGTQALEAQVDSNICGPDILDFESCLPVISKLFPPRCRHRAGHQCQFPLLAFLLPGGASVNEGFSVGKKQIQRADPIIELNTGPDYPEAGQWRIRRDRRE